MRRPPSSSSAALLMSQRQMVTVTREGQVSYVVYEVPDPPSFVERVASLRVDAVRKMGEPLEEAVWLRCDACGAVEELDAGAPMWPNDWTEDERGDICPKCG